MDTANKIKVGDKIKAYVLDKGTYNECKRINEGVYVVVEDTDFDSEESRYALMNIDTHRIATSWFVTLDGLEYRFGSTKPKHTELMICKCGKRLKLDACKYIGADRINEYKCKECNSTYTETLYGARNTEIKSTLVERQKA